MSVWPTKPGHFFLAGAAIAGGNVFAAVIVHAGAGASGGEQLDTLVNVFHWVPWAAFVGGLIGYAISKGLKSRSFIKQTRWISAMLVLVSPGVPIASGLIDSTPPSDSCLTTEFNRNLKTFAKVGETAGIRQSFFEQGIMGPPGGATTDIDRLSNMVHAKPTYPEEGRVLVMWRWGDRSKGYAHLIHPPNSVLPNLEQGLTSANRSSDGRWYRALRQRWYIYSE
jgi:hypothetical protein